MIAHQFIPGRDGLCVRCRLRQHPSPSGGTSPQWGPTVGPVIEDTLERSRVISILDAWADSHETDGTVELVRAMGDGASWGLKLSRASNRSDPSKIGVNDISYYDEDGNRCWFFEAETADAARAAAAKAIEAGEV